MKILAALLLIGAVTTANAQNTPVGLWKSVDENTGQDKSLVRITDTGGVLSGKVEKLFHPSRPNPTCDKCGDDRKGKPIVGLPIIEGLKQDGDVWDGGKILDPESGKVYTVRLRPVEGGKTLEVRAYLGPFHRTQTWSRVE
jgi:uncharacterized protein (DUF2147 family)